MKKVDYIVVGGGFAGLFFVHQLIKNNKSFILVSDRKQSASEVSGGVVNPIVLNKFTSFWLGNEQMAFLKTTLSEIHKYLGKDYFEQKPVHRILHDDNEKQTWFEKSKLDELSDYLSPEFLDFTSVINPYGIGEVLQSGRIAVSTFFSDFYSYLDKNNSYFNATFDFNHLNVNDKTYQNIEYQNLVFSEGIRVLNNPYFSNLPIIPSKGHHLSVKLSEPITEGGILKKKHFFFPMENGLYYAGGTFDRNSTDESIMDDSVNALKESIEEIYPHPYSVELVEVGLRPTLTDRRPTLGEHPQHKNMYILNGMGTRGVLNGCYFANELYQHIENGAELHPEIDIKRYQ